MAPGGDIVDFYAVHKLQMGWFGPEDVAVVDCLDSVDLSQVRVARVDADDASFYFEMIEGETYVTALPVGNPTATFQEASTISSPVDLLVPESTARGETPVGDQGSITPRFDCLARSP
jgi:hypothetical protein